ncbi:hypothetical protein EYF80_020219 [Liparis tanakae]|uniref:Uncharacterized protein n=1 Tax=Liparis tanakae TaxID=230148 RepID=A0A4Z2HX20_9TELE|nr:hypothetical protein EYF80_020219 [Liparis tanakae]
MEMRPPCVTWRHFPFIHFTLGIGSPPTLAMKVATDSVEGRQAVPSEKLILVLPPGATSFLSFIHETFSGAEPHTWQRRLSRSPSSTVRGFRATSNTGGFFASGGREERGERREERERRRGGKVGRRRRRGRQGRRRKERKMSRRGERRKEKRKREGNEGEEEEDKEEKRRKRRKEKKRRRRRGEKEEDEEEEEKEGDEEEYVSGS